MKLTSFLILILLIGFVSCQKPDTDPDPVLPEELPKSKLVSVSKKGEVKVEDLKAIASAFHYDSFADSFKYDVSIYVVEYSTLYKGKDIVASGVIFLPKTSTDSLPILSAHHGTTFEKGDAPSSAWGGSGEEFAASLGFITFSPDYLGYGSSSDIFHPYYDEHHSAYTIIDMIKAGKEFLEKEKIKMNGKLFLLGYSEGGYVTLAAQKAIEADPSHELKLSAVAAGAGGYNLMGMLESVTHSTNYPYPAYIAFVVKSFITTNDWENTLNYFFAEKYAGVLENKLTGYYSGGEINSLLTTSLDSLFNPVFYSNIKSGGEAEFRNMLLKNSVDDFIPKTPLQLYHGTSDEIIPYKNSEESYKKFISGAAKEVKLIPVYGGSHSSSFMPMLKKVYDWFLEVNEK